MGLNGLEGESRMDILDLILIWGLTLWVVAVAPKFHLRISVLPESTQSDLQGKFWLPSHQILILNLQGKSLPSQDPEAQRNQGSSANTLVVSCFLKVFQQWGMFDLLSAFFQAGNLRCSLNAEQTKLWLTCCFDLWEFIGARREEMGQGPWRN